LAALLVVTAAAGRPVARWDRSPRGVARTAPLVLSLLVVEAAVIVHHRGDPETIIEQADIVGDASLPHRRRPLYSSAAKSRLAFGERASLLASFNR
jgi:hypothetical protein